METQPVSNRLYSIIVLLDMQTTFFTSVLDGIKDEDAHQRLNTKANHIAWLTGSLVQQRFELTHLLGRDVKAQADDLFNQNQGIKDGVTYPSLATFKDDWQRITPILREALLNVTDEKLDSTFEMMPGYSMAYFDMITFCTYREANCIGQIALWRRLLGYEPMKYM